jgi:hypothetical protein
MRAVPIRQQARHGMNNAQAYRSAVALPQNTL